MLYCSGSKLKSEFAIFDAILGTLSGVHYHHYWMCHIRTFEACLLNSRCSSKCNNPGVPLFKNPITGDNIVSSTLKGILVLSSNFLKGQLEFFTWLRIPTAISCILHKVSDCDIANVALEHEWITTKKSRQIINFSCLNKYLWKCSVFVRKHIL